MRTEFETKAGCLALHPAPQTFPLSLSLHQQNPVAAMCGITAKATTATKASLTSLPKLLISNSKDPDKSLMETPPFACHTLHWLVNLSPSLGLPVQQHDTHPTHTTLHHHTSVAGDGSQCSKGYREATISIPNKFVFKNTLHLDNRETFHDTHRIFDFQVITIFRHIRNFKSVLFLHFLKIETSHQWTHGI